LTSNSMRRKHFLKVSISAGNTLLSGKLNNQGYFV